MRRSRPPVVPGSRPGRRLAALTFAVAIAGATGCGGSDASTGPDDADPPIEHSFEAILGDWEGESVDRGGGRIDWIELSITEARGTRGEIVGTLDSYASRDGTPYCLGNLVAWSSAPPLYSFKYDATFVDEEHCEPEGTVRLDYRVEDELLTYGWREQGEALFWLVARLPRSGG